MTQYFPLAQKMATLAQTYFTDSYYKNANKAKARLALPEKPTYIMEFEIDGNPNISGGTRVKPNYGEIGGGREYYTYDLIKVNIINFQIICQIIRK